MIDRRAFTSGVLAAGAAAGLKPLALPAAVPAQVEMKLTMASVSWEEFLRLILDEFERIYGTRPVPDGTDYLFAELLARSCWNQMEMTNTMLDSFSPATINHEGLDALFLDAETNLLAQRRRELSQKRLRG